MYAKNIKEMAEIIIKEEKRPLSSTEILKIAEQKGYKEKLGLKGRTIANSINSTINTNIKKPSSIFIKNDKKFYLRELLPIDNMGLLNKQSISKTTQKVKPYREKDLHPLLSYYVSRYISIYTKTISHEISTKKNYSQWQHPDIVGVYYSMEQLESNVYSIINCTGNQAIKLFSFELKKELNFNNLRESYFQALSNSSWANEGYLVTSKIDEKDKKKKDKFMQEIRRLSNSFGIGLILLNIDEPDDSKILLGARQKDILDIEKMSKLSNENPDFKKFLETIKDDLENGKVREKSFFDKILEPDELRKKYNY
jgi:hypothetical protein